MGKQMIDQIFKYFGGQHALAKLLGVSEAAVSQWKAQGMPAFRAAQIELHSKGKFKVVDILKDQLKKAKNG